MFHRFFGASIYVILDIEPDVAQQILFLPFDWRYEKKENITVVVDGANDVKLFDISDLGIAFRAQDLVKDLATVTLDDKDLTKVIPIINNHYNLTLGL